MIYKNIVVPFLSNEKIKEAADLFRKKFWGSHTPIDIEYIIDVRLKIDIVLIPDFLKNCNIDALISSNWQCIHVDKDEYEDERRHNRLRFSLAHEIGHFVLHKNIYKSFNVKGFSDYYKLYKTLPQKQYSYFETQANKFANYLLVPREILAIEREEKLKERGNPDWFKEIDTKTLNSYLAIPISKIFNVSEEVIAIALSEFSEI